VTDPTAEKPKPPSVTGSQPIDVQALLRHDSRILPIEKADGLLALMIVLVVGQVLGERWSATAVYLLGLCLLAALPWLMTQQERLPAWARRLLVPIAERMTACPAELGLIVGVAPLVALKWFPGLDRWRELLMVGLLVFGFWFSRHINLVLSGYRHGRLGWWLRRALAGKSTLTAAAREVTPGSVTVAMAQHQPGAAGEAKSTESQILSRRTWERKQQQRWEEWMKEEQARLNGEYSDENKSG